MLERRRCAAGRPAQPLQGLPRGHRAGGVDAAARRTVLRATTHRAAAPVARRRHRRRGRARSRSRAARRLPWERLLLATGRRADPPSHSRARPADVHMLRSLADSRAIIARAKTARRAVVVGASFIGLEVAASLRARGLEVHVVAPDSGRSSASSAPSSATSSARCTRSTASSSTSETTASAIDGRTGRGCRAARARGRPRRRRHRRAPARRARRGGRPHVDRGVVVDEYLETSAPGVFAAGDIARWPDPHERRGDPHRALGRRRAPGPDRGAQHARRPRALRGRAVLLEPALRHPDQLRRPRRALGRNRRRGKHRRQGLPRPLQARRPHARRRLDLPRPSEPGSGAGMERDEAA